MDGYAYGILSLYFANEAVASVHYAIFVVAAIQEHSIWKCQIEGQQEQQHLQPSLAPIHKVAIEDIRIASGRQSVLKYHFKHLNAN